MKHIFSIVAGIVLALQMVGADKPPLVPGDVIEITGSTGKSDFLNVDSVNHRLLGAHEKDDTFDIFDLSTKTLVTRIKLGGVVDAKLDAKSGRYFVSVQDDKKLVVLDAKTLAEVGTVTFDGEIDATCFDTKNRRLYVAHDNGSHLWAVDLATLKVVADVAIPGTPECMAYDESAGRIYLAIKSANTVAVIDTGKNTVVASWGIAPAVAPHGLVYDGKVKKLFVAGDNGQLVALDVKTGTVVGSLGITPHVDQAAIDPSLKRVYCAGDSFLSVVEYKSNGSLVLVGNVPSAATAKNVAVDTQTHAVWSTYTDGKNAFAKSWNQP